MSGPLKKVLIGLFLVFLTVSAFLVRLDNFKKTVMWSIDEVVYSRMAKQILTEGPSGYNTIPYGKELADGGRDLPDYFFQPLFKHPPLFTFMVALSMKVFGINEISAEYVSLLFGVLLIPLTYFLGTMLFDRRVGLCAALFMWIDPVTVMTSQKIWPDTAMNFLMLLSILFFVKAIKSKADNYFILCGLACGLALLTKYTAILTLVTIISITFIHRRNLFFNKIFIFSLVLPFLILLPWFYWNFQVYGSNFLVKQQSFHQNSTLVKWILFFILSLVILSILFKILYFLRKGTSNAGANALESLEPMEGISKRKINIAIGFFLLGGTYQSIVQSLQFNHIPRTSWASATFNFEPPIFYIGQLIEYSFVYFFGFAALFINRNTALIDRAILRYGAAIILIFFTTWRSFQCRYVLFAIPLLIILAFELILFGYDRISKIENYLLRILSKSTFLLFIIYCLGKTIFINLNLSFSNDMCYF